MGINQGKSLAVLFLTFSAALSAAPRLGLSSAAVGTVQVVPGANGPAQTVQAFNLGDGNLNLAATASASWLAATVGGKTACGQPGGSCYPVNIALNTSALTPGTYTGYVTVTDPNAVDSPQDIAVTVSTAGVPGAVTAYVNPAGTLTSQTMIPIYTAGTGVKAAVTTQSGGNWLQFQNGKAGLVTFPFPWFLQINALAAQAPGTYTGTVVLSGSSAPSDNKTINVTLIVAAGPIVDLTSSLAVRITGYQGGPAQSAFPVLNNMGQGTLAISAASAASSNKFLSASVLNANTLQITADPTGLSPGTYTGSVTIASNAANNSAVSIPVEFLVAPAGNPLISTNGVINIATYAQEGVSQGDIAAVFGSQFAANGTVATNASTPLATTLAGTQVLVNGVPAPLYFVSPGQINFQVPYSLAKGQAATVQVVSGGKPGNSRPLSITANAARLLYFLSFIQGNYGVIVNNSDGSLTLPSGTNVPGFQCHPAKPGDTIIIYGIGFGQTTPPAVEGAAANSTPLQSISGVTASLGGGFLGNAFIVNAGFAGLTPTAVGLYQINVTIPAVAPFGNAVPLMATVNGVASNTVTLAISANGR